MILTTSDEYIISLKLPINNTNLDLYSVNLTMNID